MKELSIPSAAKLRMAILNKGSGLDRTRLEKCPDQYPNLEVYDDVEVHRAMRDTGLSIDQLFSFGEDFSRFQVLRNFDLLLLTFRSNQKDYIRIVNYLGGYVTTSLLDISRPTCEQILRGQRLAVIQSMPPLADVSINDRMVGEAPTWVWLKDGQYQVRCKAEGHVFKPKTLKIPDQTSLLCQRENEEGNPAVDEKEKMTGEEKAGAVLIYIIGIAGTAAAIVLPFLFLF